MPKVNPNILEWARTTAGLSEEEAVKKLGIKEARGVGPTERLAALESGDTAPTRAMVVKMSKQYRRPLLTFYLSDKPRTGDRGQDYRTLPDTVETMDKALVDVLIRDIRVRQSLVRAALEDEDEAEKLPFIGSIKMSGGINTAVFSIQKYLKWSTADYGGQPTIDKAFGYLRGKAEEAGVFVLLVDNLGSHHTTISLEAFRGFALADEVAPFIAINVNDSKGAWCFTLVHELAHIWLGSTGVSGNTADQAIEKFCNDVASEFLLPMDELQSLGVGNRTDFASAKALISEWAQARNVSGTMVAYKLCRAEIISFERFLTFKSAFREDWEKSKRAQRAKLKEKESGGPTYYVTRRHRLGDALINLVGRMMYGGALTTTKAGKVLGVRPQNVQGVLAKDNSNFPGERAIGERSWFISSMPMF